MESAFLRVMDLLGTEYAAAWHDALLRAIHELPAFPGPRSHPRDEEASAAYRAEVRRMLYYGPQSRRSKTAPRWRVLFSLVEPPQGEVEGALHALRVLHGAQRVLVADSDDADTIV